MKATQTLHCTCQNSPRTPGHILQDLQSLQIFKSPNPAPAKRTPMKNYEANMKNSYWWWDLWGWPVSLTSYLSMWNWAQVMKTLAKDTSGMWMNDQFLFNTSHFGNWQYKTQHNQGNWHACTGSWQGQLKQFFFFGSLNLTIFLLGHSKSGILGKCNVKI